jgi:hypothetical protein
MPKSTAFPWTDEEIERRVRAAVRAYWRSRSGQASKQKGLGVVADYGTRSEVTGGQHLGAFTELLCALIRKAGFTSEELRFKRGVELPGFYRPTKKWDVIVVRGNRLCAAIELKSQVGPSFGNNFNNRTEEAVGSSVDLWRAFKEGVLGAHAPWLGYFFFLEHANKSTRPVKLAATPFKIDPIFPGTSYAERYRILCQRMVLERHYNGATLLLAPRGRAGRFSEPEPDLRVASFLKALYGHLIGCSE